MPAKKSATNTDIYTSSKLTISIFYGLTVMIGNDMLLDIIHELKIPVVRSYENVTMNDVKKWDNCEGVVISFDNGHKIKVKADMYVLRHKSKDSLSVEKNVISYIVNDQVDDVMPYLQEEDQKRLSEFQNVFWDNFDRVVAETSDMVNVAITESENNRKKFAVEVSVKYPSWIKSIVFGAMDGKSVKDILLNTIRSNVSTATKVESVRHLFGGITWSYDFFDGEK